MRDCRHDIWEAMQAQEDIADLMKHYRHDRELPT